MSVASHRLKASDGVELAWYELGEGRPVLLLHGLFSTADMNWLKFGHAAQIAHAGFRVIMPDLRAHGRSGAPHDPSFYPPDILARDGFDLLDRLGLRSSSPAPRTGTTARRRSLPTCFRAAASSRCRAII
jgi:pimeloyl-ACP methyl ester carboxylesterase